ncbi:glycosyltransferase family 39 protein [Lacisediminihabitans changchengi]|uniref:Glycosyltransferase family 39 protein n=1 Tax=Lacisediminihabitans changchengi TaxID=2787634 RepID=A0A934SPA3_9MICO|nr:glycosyltransferase family 39 protein [Lacisediminihabitans changchengi]MBK4349121.1 glycosyltransferase family 39 protein [Lacisediminihabitans changchengi]
MSTQSRWSISARASVIRTLTRAIMYGRTTAATWERPALLGLLVATAVLYLWNLTASGYANSFYSAAVQAGSVNWEAFFYGSSDAANSITVDKPPASLWFMALSVRVFGLSSFSILLPEVLMGIATVALVYAIVRRHFSARAALLAGGVLALTPVAALMFRFNNPDALLVLLMTLAVFFTLRGIESGKVRWILWAGAVVGFGFLTKQLQAFLIVPVLVAAYLWMSQRRLGTRILHLLGALGTLVLSAGWWVAIVELVPASMRPFIGGSQSNSFLELTFGYNGLGRITGDETGSVGGGGGTGGNWGSTGILRLFEGEIGGQITWLLPAALIVMVAGFALLWKTPRTDGKRAVLFLFSGWLLVTAVAFSFMAGIFHAYYTVALAPPLAGVVAVGASLLWSRRAEFWARIIASATVLLTALWSFALLSEASTWLPWLKWLVLAVCVIAAALLLLPNRGRMLTAATIAATLVGALMAPTAYTLQTVSTAHTGSIVTAGPTVSGAMGGGRRGGFGGPGAPGGTPPGGTPPGGNAGSQALPTGGMGGGMGGLLGGGSASSAVTALLSTDAADYTWVAAAVGSNNAAGYQLASGDPVMALGGFNGSDPSPTLAEFTTLVAAGKIHYFVGSGSFGQSRGGSSEASDIAAWVAAHFAAQTVDGVTVYDLSA